VTAKSRHDPPVSGIPAEFTVAKSMGPALYAGACRALINAAASGSGEGEGSLSPDVLVRAEFTHDFWLGVARYEQRLATTAGPQERAAANAEGLTLKSS
jgi:hypothetical protein